MLADPPERPPIADAPLSVVLLARSGAVDLEAVVQAWLAWLDQRPGDCEVLLMVEGLDAPTISLADPRLRIINHVAPAGIGPCLQTAVWLAKHPLMLTAPADRQFQPADAQRLFEQINKVDLVTGVRVHRPPPLWLRVLGLLKRIASLIFLGYFGEPRAAWFGWRGWGRRFRIRHVFGVRVADAECPLRLYRKEVFTRVPIQSRGSFAHVEVLAKTNHLSCLMAEAPVPWTPLPQEGEDSDWQADAKLVFRRPEFGTPLPPTPPVVPAGDGSTAVLQ
jgi:hypothetical protein